MEELKNRYYSGKLSFSEKKSRPQKDSQRKPDGISREVYALTGGVAPLMPSIDPNQLKKHHQPENEKITWEWLAFTNSARKDNLQLYHWVRVVNGTPPPGDYSFAKYNNSSDAFFFLSSLLPTVVYGSLPDNISQEIERKRALSMVLSQTKHQERKDAEVLSEAKKITESRMAAKAAQDAELAVTSNISPEGVEKTGAPADTALTSSMQLRVNLRTYALDQMVEAASSSAGLRTIKRVEQLLQELKVSYYPFLYTFFNARLLLLSFVVYYLTHTVRLMKANSSGVRRGKESSS
ncbi:unnamed protein product [Lactuca virosa]|uniref:Uncharacterized protein n=1 Tax=Lactuca virosa TaxID=75947 RepID=A0AAU9MF78_9ASTR|nr:unnamed protein product [Lactuca virosa]